MNMSSVLTLHPSTSPTPRDPAGIRIARFAEVELRTLYWHTRLSKMVGYTEKSDISH